MLESLFNKVAGLDSFRTPPVASFKEYNTEECIQPVLYSSRPIRLQIFCTLVITTSTFTTEKNSEILRFSNDLTFNTEANIRRI